MSFWIAATSALILLAEQVYSNHLDRGPRVELVWIVLFFLVALQMLRSLRFGEALRLTLALWVSIGLLARVLVY